jgi:hypothetical protein
MHRRALLKLGFASAAVLSVAGAAAWMWQPGLQGNRLSPSSRAIFLACGGAILQGTLPAAEPTRRQALEALLGRVDTLIAGLPPATRAELAQLLSVLNTLPGRLGLAGLPVPWSEATGPQVQHALQSMRMSSLPLRQQAYRALHEIINGAYFSEPATWRDLGYPGPLPL